MKYTTLLFFLLFLFACRPELPKNEAGQKEFIDDYFGWAMQIPDDFIYLSALENKYYEQKGKKAIKEGLGDNTMDDFQEILKIQKGDDYTFLHAQSTTFQPALEGSDYNQVRKRRFQAYGQIYARRASVDTELEFGTTTVDQITFATCLINILQNGEIKGYQLMYEHKYDNDEVFMVGLTSRDKGHLDLLREMFESSTLSKTKL